MLLEARPFGLRFYVGVRITAVIDEERASGDGPAQAWGWSYQTLKGHLEQGQLSYEVIKNLSTGRVTFRVAGYSWPAPVQNPVIRLGFWLFGRRTQERFYRNIQSRMADLGPGRAAWPAPAVADGRPSSDERQHHPVTGWNTVHGATIEFLDARLTSFRE